MKWACCLSNLHWTNSHTVKANDIKEHPPLLAGLPGLAGRPGPELGMQGKHYYFSQTDCLSGRGFKYIVRAVSGHLHLPAWTSAVDEERMAVSQDAIPVLFQNIEFPLEEARFAADKK